MSNSIHGTTTRQKVATLVLTQVYMLLRMSFTSSDSSTSSDTPSSGGSSSSIGGSGAMIDFAEEEEDKNEEAKEDDSSNNKQGSHYFEALPDTLDLVTDLRDAEENYKFSEPLI